MTLNIVESVIVLHDSPTWPDSVWGDRHRTTLRYCLRVVFLPSTTQQRSAWWYIALLKGLCYIINSFLVEFI